MSGELTGQELDVRAVVDRDSAKDCGIAHAEALVDFADALVAAEEPELSQARSRVLHEVGAEGLVDAAAVAANFERMVRIADSTGIPVDGFMSTLSADVRRELDLASFAGAASSRSGGTLQYLFSRYGRGLLLRGVQWVSRVRRSG